jgi:two-component system response regulator BaeR
MVVEDDPKLAALLADYIRAEGYTPLTEADGARALARIRATSPAALILDLMLPGLDGLSICREVRGFSAIPILMLTAKVAEVDRLLGLDGGADDYICKPFSPREVMARLRAQLRRASGALTPARQAWQDDQAAQRILWQGTDLRLTAVEYRLLRALLRRPDTLFSRAQLLDLLHDDFRDVSDRVIDTHVKNIRRKLEDAAGAGRCIASVYGVGYRFEYPEA